MLRATTKYVRSHSQRTWSLIISSREQKAYKTRLTGIKDELKHVERELRQLQPDLRKAQATYDNVKGKIDALAAVINAAEDEVFEDFCREIGVANIREYEERQLKLAQAESDARLQFDTQIARLTHAYVFALTA